MKNGRQDRIAETLTRKKPMNKGFQWVKRVKATCYQLFRGKHFCLFRQDKKATLYVYKYICAILSNTA